MDELTTPLDFSGYYPATGIEAERTRSVEVQLPAASFFRRGLVMCQPDATSWVFRPGSSGAKGILRFDSWVDATGTIYTVDAALGDLWPQYTYRSLPVFVCGRFNTADLVGLTEEAMSDMRGRLLSGTLENGVLEIP